MRHMSDNPEFSAAVAASKQLAKTPSTTDLLELYALYKQANDGDVSGSRPGMLDLKGRAKYDAWAQKRGTTRQQAQAAYVALVARLSAS